VVNAYERRPRPAIWGPVLIAAIFLAIIGGSAGWIAGGWAKAADERAAADQNQDVPQDGPEVVDDVPQNDAGDGGNDGGDGGNDAGGDRPAADRCPAHTRQLAAKSGAVGKLTVKFYLRTTRSHVWICADENGRLFYQGFRGRLGGAQMVEGRTALFLTDVSEDAEGCVAVNKDGDRVTTYRVTSDRLVITYPDGKEVVENAA
jgi:hypothetical protein